MVAQSIARQEEKRVPRRNRPVSPRYKWIALTNTTLGVLMATIDSSIVLISLPVIFKGIHIDPLAPGETGYFLWMLMGYMVVTATLLVTFGRISDMFGRVRFYNLGFLIFTIGSILLWLTPGTGNAGALELILFRFVQGIGGGFLLSNSAAIITDAFPEHQRGFALGINQIAAILGSVIGLILGGILSYFDWRLVFLVSVPVGIVGTIWAYTMLRETATPRKRQRIDWLGNITFAVGATVLLIGITYGIEPYGDSPTGWGNPLVLGALVLGVLLLAAFVWIELRVPDPMFRLDLFKIRMFAAGNASSFLASIARGGLQFMLIIWLQGIWLPLHGYDYEVAPLWAGIYMIPLMIGFLLMGPLSGWLSDRFGARPFSTLGMLIQALGFFLLTILPLNFDYIWFALILFMLGIGQGMFSSPNTSSIMGSVPREQRGVASGMRSTFQNSGSIVSIGIFFSLIILGLASSLPTTLLRGLTAAGVPASVADRIAHLPPTSALFAAFLGYNPMAQLVPGKVLNALPAADKANLLGHSFFPNLISSPFAVGLHSVFYLSAAMCLVAALASVLRGKQQLARPVEVSQEEAEAKIHATTDAD
ncbi:MFS transporter [Ktedonobacter sp. SOSP1-52]|uniref:MFS transporter n=1 Tax=Ktedonobacter sp. SOSP1-52 TaxID=2778366 RepID=UPI00191569B4|nr:MFS transporter [Ktedonobacter sp. SOSP1-52]GHO68176.1 MFS transporter [Ktedonobacter sp. SOSP1-52]